MSKPSQIKVFSSLTVYFPFQKKIIYREVAHSLLRESLKIDLKTLLQISHNMYNHLP